MGHHWVTILEANDVSVFPIGPFGQPEFESGLSPFSVRFGSGLSGLVRIRVRSGPVFLGKPDPDSPDRTF